MYRIRAGSRNVAAIRSVGNACLLGMGLVLCQTAAGCAAYLPDVQHELIPDAFVSVSAGMAHSCRSRADGIIACWGHNRGLQSPDLWAAIRCQGWHPYMRYDRHMTFQATTGPRWPAWRFVAREGQYTVTAGKAFRERKRSCTLIVLWVPGQEHPWVVLTDEAPDDVELGAYGLRVWIEQGFRTLKRMGWQWHRTRRRDPARVDRHGLVLAVATLWVLAHGTRVEEARLRGRAPGRLRRPPLQPATVSRPRPLSVF